MKLWIKLALMTVLILLISMGFFGAEMIYRSILYNQEKTIESCEQQLRSTAYAIGRERSYINYVVKKYGASQYILIEDAQEVCNLTPFALKNPGDERWNQSQCSSVIQRRGEQYILISGKAVSVVGEAAYKLVLVQDISELYQDMREQAFLSLLVFLGAVAVCVILVFLVTKKILRPLRELQHAARDISAGKLERRANVSGRDEIGLMAADFNKMADRIEDQVTELSKVSEQRRQMLGSLTHEMKTPMTSIIGYSDTLLHVNLKKEQQERALSHIKEECSRLERLSSKLMSLIGLYENDSICMEKVSMQELFEQVARLEEHPLKQRGIRLVYSCHMEDQKIDRDLFESLLVNLIDNGAKASEAGMTIYLTGEGNVITVSDQGCGIPREEIERVTEAFYMVDKARSRKAGGCGLGLSLCSMIAQLHHASLSIESEIEKGTKVSIIFL